MIIILGFIRRLQFKSAVYFSLPFGLLVFIFADLLSSISSIMYLIFSLQFLSKLVNRLDRKQVTGISCRLCGYDNCIILYKGTNKKSERLGSFACSSFDHGKYEDIYYCPECKNGFLKSVSERTKELKESGEALYKDVVDEEYVKNLDARYLTNNYLAQIYKEHIANKNVLEIGSYYGAFCNAVIEKTASFVGIEPSTHACQFVKQKYKNANIINGTLDLALERNQVYPEQFDTVFLWDVIEHVSDPIDILRKINKILKKDGIVIFSTINIESTFSILLGPRWPWFMDMHYYYFSDRGYVDILHQSGFVMKSHSHFSYYVKLEYFIKKVISMINLKIAMKFKLSRLNPPIKISFGDTVAIVGKKVT
jgi:2-polyprenyl-3-methyl-5-hydroxy-6-metoxy-1,4-benzoquinol methylase